MNADEFRKYGKEAIDFIADYMENIRERPALPSVEPGYFQKMLPDDAPEEGQPFDGFFDEMERLIMPGITHWHSPRFHAYYPAGNSYPSIIGEILDAGLGAIGFSWLTSPILTELEVKMMDWLGKLIGLPEAFLHCSGGPGGGIIQSCASETILVTLVSARERTLLAVKAEHPDWDEHLIKSKMVAYTSDQSNSAVEKAGRIASVPMKLLESDNLCCLRGSTLRAAVERDIAQGLIPTYLCATLGTTGTCAFDRIDELGAVCQEFGIWLHIDAAYAGSAFVCPEMRAPMRGVELADSYNFNPHKWLLVNFECSAFWVKRTSWLVDALYIDRIYLKHHKQGVVAAPDYRNWEIPLGRRFRSLKLWLVLKTYGAKGLQEHIRGHVTLAKKFEEMLRRDSKYEIVHAASMGLVCFKLKDGCRQTKKLLDGLNERKNIYVVAGTAKGTYFVRFSICGRETNLTDVEYSFDEINTVAEEICKPRNGITKAPHISVLQQQINSLWLSLDEDLSDKLPLKNDIAPLCAPEDDPEMIATRL